MIGPDESERCGDERIMILIPPGRDGSPVETLLSEAGMTAKTCRGMAELMHELERGAGCAVLTEAAAGTADLAALSAWLDAQPAWSDLPLIVLTGRDRGTGRTAGTLRLIEALGNVTLLERPFHPSTFLARVRSAVRARRRQYEARTRMDAFVRIEASLKDSEARFRTLTDNIPVLTWIADPGGSVSWYSSRWYDYTGTTPEQMAGAGWPSVHDPDALPAILETWRVAIERGETFEAVYPLRGADGVFRPFLTRVTPVSHEGRVVRWLGTHVDISAERDAAAAVRAAEEKLRANNETLERQVAERTAHLRLNEARLRTIFATSLQAQGLLAVDGRVLEANATSLALIRGRLDDVAGMLFWETPWFTATPDMPELVREAVAAAARGESMRQEVTVNLPDGPRSMDFSVRPIRDESGTVVAILPEATDITERRQAEDGLRQAQKMEAIGQLTGGIAHDFNNMLQGIAGGVELARRRIASGKAADADHYLSSVLQSADRAAALTHRLLAFSRRQALAPKRVAIGELVSALSVLIRQTVGPAIAVNVDLMEGGWPVRCDPNQMENALLNLAINARDAMLPNGGELLFRTRHVRLGGSDLAGWTGARPGDYVRISVTDSGTGMSPDVLEHVFEPFFTTKPDGQGTGLGLSQVFGFISQSNGVVRIESRVGAGTSVHLDLPRHLEPDVGAAAEQAQTAQIGTFMAATVLLVEDEAEIRRVAAEALRDRGCKVIEAENGYAGLTLLRALVGTAKGAIDMLVADVGLPGGLNGRQLADAARELAPGLPVLLITGYAGEAFGPAAQLANGMELLTKPFALEALTARVEAMLAG